MMNRPNDDWCDEVAETVARFTPDVWVQDAVTAYLIDLCEFEEWQLTVDMMSYVDSMDDMQLNVLIGFAEFMQRKPPINTPE
jgi:hypothetical protein